MIATPEQVDAQMDHVMGKIMDATLRRVAPLLRKGDRIAVSGPVYAPEHPMGAVRLTVQRDHVCIEVTNEDFDACVLELAEAMRRENAVAAAVAETLKH